MKVVKYASDEELKIFKEKLKETGGYCPCVPPHKRNEDTRCLCKNFIEMPVGSVCHCGIYKKLED